MPWASVETYILHEKSTLGEATQKVEDYNLW